MRNLTADDEVPMRRRANRGKTRRVAKNDLLDSVSVRSKRYVYSSFVMFSSTIATKDRILSLFNVDACAWKVFFESYTLYLVLGFTSNFNIVPVAYFWICANESISSWTRVFGFIKSCLPDFSSSAAIVSDRDRGIAGAICTVFAEQIPHQIPCVIQSKINVARHGKKAVEVHENIVNAPTLQAPESIKRSAQFGCSNKDAHTAITEHYEDSVQVYLRLRF